jgi:hypothetical protein
LFKLTFFVNGFNMLSNGLRGDLIKSRNGCLRQPERFMFKATCDANRTVLTGKFTCRRLDYVLSVMSPPHSINLTSCSMPETAAKPGGLYLILRGAFQDADLNRGKRLYLTELCLRPFVIVQQPLLLLVIRHQNDAPFITFTVTCCPVSNPPRAATCRKE